MNTSNMLVTPSLHANQYPNIVIVFLCTLKPAAHERTCRAYLLFVTSLMDKISSCESNIYGIFVIRDM
jgi:hypothetical protein